MEPKSNTHTHTQLHTLADRRRERDLLTEWSRRHRELISKDWHGYKLAESRRECWQIPGEKRKEYPRTPLKLDGKGGGGAKAFLRSEVRIQKISVSCSRCLALLVESLVKCYQVPDSDLRHNSMLSGVNRSTEEKSVGRTNQKHSSGDEITKFSPRGTERGIKTRWSDKINS